MTTSDNAPATHDTVGTTAKTVRFPATLAEQMEDRANDQDRSFSQEVILACRSHLFNVNAPDRQELEVPGAETPPAFRLVPINPDAKTSDEGPWSPHVDGFPVPGLKVTKIDDEDWTRFEKSIGHSGEGWQLVLDDRFAIIATSYNELWRWGWFIAQVAAVAQGRPSHATNAPTPQVVEHGWRVMDDSGCVGHSYEIGLTFLLPAMADGDQWAYGARDHLVERLGELGGRDISTRLTSLTGMEPDRRIAQG